MPSGSAGDIGVCVCARARIHMHIHTYIHQRETLSSHHSVCVCVCIYICTYIHTSTSGKRHPHIIRCVYVRAYTCAHTYIHMHLRTHIHWRDTSSSHHSVVSPQPLRIHIFYHATHILPPILLCYPYSIQVVSPPCPCAYTFRE